MPVDEPSVHRGGSQGDRSEETHFPSTEEVDATMERVKAAVAAIEKGSAEEKQAMYELCEGRGSCVEAWNTGVTPGGAARKQARQWMASLEAGSRMMASVLEKADPALQKGSSLLASESAASSQSESEAMRIVCDAHATCPECLEPTDLTKTTQNIAKALGERIHNHRGKILLEALPNADDPSKIIMLRYGDRACGLADWMETYTER